MRQGLLPRPCARWPRIVKPAGSGAGQNVTLNGSTSDAARGRTLSSYSWTAVNGSPSFVGATNGPSATVAVPAAGRVTVRLEVTDDIGSTDLQEVTLGAAASSGSGGGGGGATHPLMLCALGLLLVRSRRPIATCSW